MIPSCSYCNDTGTTPSMYCNCDSGKLEWLRSLDVERARNQYTEPGVVDLVRYGLIEVKP